MFDLGRAEFDAYVAIGANLGDTAATVRWASQSLGRLPDTRLVRCSSLYRTAPVDATGPDFINAVAHVATQLSPGELLSHLHAIEQSAGRERSTQNAPRTLDLDLLLHGQARIDTPMLTVPHPRMRERAFVLVPLAEIAPALVSPGDLAAVAGQPIERIP
jgi:2-amino-4-hydroxy-6-hydroxymethyldihydropteridine diphosphokinase